VQRKTVTGLLDDESQNCLIQGGGLV
jgi:hypothetical protein